MFYLIIISCVFQDEYLTQDSQFSEEDFYFPSQKSNTQNSEEMDDNVSRDEVHFR